MLFYLISLLSIVSDELNRQFITFFVCFELCSPGKGCAKFRQRRNRVRGS
jgi:hypothetical protein